MFSIYSLPVVLCLQGITDTSMISLPQSFQILWKCSFCLAVSFFNIFISFSLSPGYKSAHSTRLIDSEKWVRAMMWSWINNKNIFQWQIAIWPFISSQLQNHIGPSSHEYTTFSLVSFQRARLILQSCEDIIILSAFT